MKYFRGVLGDSLHEKHYSDAWEKFPVQLLQDSLVQCGELILRFANEQWEALENGVFWCRRFNQFDRLWLIDGSSRRCHDELVSGGDGSEDGTIQEKASPNICLLDVTCTSPYCWASTGIVRCKTHCWTSTGSGTRLLGITWHVSLFSPLPQHFLVG